jgi:vacuolar-type H+-ATPase subunit E/Vma4
VPEVIEMTKQVTGDLGGLKERILSQATERSAGILEQAKAEAERIIQEAKIEGEQEAAQILEQAKIRTQERQRQMLIAAKLKRQKQVLRGKRALLQQAFADAVASFAKLPQAEYQEFIQKLLVETQDHACNRLVISPKEQRVSPEFIAQVTGELNWKLTLEREDDPRLEQGGFLLRGEKLEIDSTIPTIVELIRPKLEGDVAQILFGEL